MKLKVLVGQIPHQFLSLPYRNFSIHCYPISQLMCNIVIPTPPPNTTGSKETEVTASTRKQTQAITFQIMYGFGYS